VNQQAYQKALAELEIPMARIKVWVDVVQTRHHAPLKGTRQEYFDRILRSLTGLAARMPELAARRELAEHIRTFDDDLGGPVMQITGYAEILLAELRHIDDEDEDTIMCREYLDDIRAAGDYLAALIRSAQIDLYLERTKPEDAPVPPQ
jgi:signal transduction histidine kinase